jgi:CBS domain-containing protein
VVPLSSRLLVKDVMGHAVVVAEGTRLRDVAALMLARAVQGVLVVNAQAEVVGVITERQLTLSSHYLHLACAEVPEVGGRSVTTLDEVDAACIAARTLTARDVMERHLSWVCADEVAAAAVERMLRRDAEYAVVHQGNAVVGMLGSHDLLRKIAGEDAVIPETNDVLQVDGQPVRVSGARQPGTLASWFAGLWR